MVNCGLISWVFEMGFEDSGLLWLLIYYDMGLVGGILNLMYCG